MAEDLVKKLKVKVGNKVGLVNSPPGFSISYEYDDIVSANAKYDLVIAFCKDQDMLHASLNLIVSSTKDQGIIWFAFPKGTSKIQTDLTRDKGWEKLMALNYKWLSLISLNDQWSAFAVKKGLFNEQHLATTKENLKTLDGRLVINYENREVMMPKELQELVEQDANAMQFYNKLSYSCRKEYLEYVYSAKKIETQEQRMIKVLDYLKAGKRYP